MLLGFLLSCLDCLCSTRRCSDMVLMPAEIHVAAVWLFSASSWLCVSFYEIMLSFAAICYLFNHDFSRSLLNNRITIYCVGSWILFVKHCSIRNGISSDVTCWLNCTPCCLRGSQTLWFLGCSGGQRVQEGQESSVLCVLHLRFSRSKPLFVFQFMFLLCFDASFDLNNCFLF